MNMPLGTAQDAAMDLAVKTAQVELSDYLNVNTGLGGLAGAALGAGAGYALLLGGESNSVAVEHALRRGRKRHNSRYNCGARVYL
jgi:hypothetical protein